jgi:hypothetical protein
MGSGGAHAVFFRGSVMISNAACPPGGATGGTTQMAWVAGKLRSDEGSSLWRAFFVGTHTGMLLFAAVSGISMNNPTVTRRSIFPWKK